MKRATRLTTVENVKEQHLIISLEIKDEFVVSFIAVLKNRLRNLNKEDIQKTVSLSVFFFVFVFLFFCFFVFLFFCFFVFLFFCFFVFFVLLVMVKTDHRLKGGKGIFVIRECPNFFP